MKMEKFEKNLEVTYAGEGQGRNRKLDKDGNTIMKLKVQEI